MASYTSEQMDVCMLSFQVACEGNLPELSKGNLSAIDVKGDF